MHGERLALLRADQLQRAAQAGQHAEPKNVYLHEPKRVNIVFIPLNDCAVGHGRVFDGHLSVKPPLRNHKSTRMLRQVTRKTDQLIGVFQ